MLLEGVVPPEENSMIVHSLSDGRHEGSSDYLLAFVHARPDIGRELFLVVLILASSW